MLEHIWHTFRFRSWENSWKKFGEFHQHVNIQITHKNVHLRPVHVSHSLKVVTPVHSPTRMLLKLMNGYLNAWWSHVRSIMASAGDFGMMWCITMGSTMVDARLQSFLSALMTLLVHRHLKVCKTGAEGSYFSFIFKFIGTMRRNGCWWNTWMACTETGFTLWEK